MQIFCLMLAFSFRTSILHLFFMCLRNILNNSIWQNNFPGHKSQKNFLHFHAFNIFSSRPKQLISLTIHATYDNYSFQKNSISESLYCERQHLKFNARMKKINILQFAIRTKITFSSIKPLFATRWLLIYWSPEALWDRSGKKTLGTQIYSFTTHKFFTLNHC